MTFDLGPFRDQYPWASRWFDRDGLQLHYLDEGQGEALVMVHGNPSWSWFWRSLVAELSGSYRTVVPDHIGMGLSDKPADDRYHYTLASRVDDLEALLEHLQIKEDITLVLHDWGGMIGLAFAARYPGRVRRIVLTNTAGFSLPDGLAIPWQLWLIKHLPFAIPVRGLNAFCRGATTMCSTRPGGLSAQVKAAYLAPYDSWANRIAIHRFVQDIPLGPDDEAWAVVKGVERYLESIAALPVQILWGERDFVFDAHFLAEWRRRLPSAEFHTFADCGHYLLEDAPDEVGALVTEFLARHPLDPDSAAGDAAGASSSSRESS